MNVLISGIVACTILAILILQSVHEERRWKQKWPAIDDDEFMRRCPAGTNRVIALKVRRLVAKHVGIAIENIHPQQNFVDDLIR